ncbi:sigma factor [Kitasatospora sp. NPDC059648]|uniref:sigma factor n=1 Tax=Kitasatospora sp. NPDC059648 TaxID=3346894 RepID=UPI0036BE4F1A
MPDHERQAGQFEHLRPRMLALAYPLLGSFDEAEEAVRKAWARLARINPAEVTDLAAWLTVVTSRVCLDLLGARPGQAGQEGLRLPDAVVEAEASGEPGRSAPVGLALLVALDALAPAERVAFVLQDLVRLHVDQVATVLERTTADTRRLAEQARRRVQEAREADGEGSPAVRRRLVDAFCAAVLDGDPAALAAALEPEAALHADGWHPLRGAQQVAQRAVTLCQGGPAFTAVLVNGSPGALVTRDGVPTAVLGFAVRAGRISRVQFLLDPRRLAAIDVDALPRW